MKYLGILVFALFLGIPAFAGENLIDDRDLAAMSGGTNNQSSIQEEVGISSQCHTMGQQVNMPMNWDGKSKKASAPGGAQPGSNGVTD